MAEQDLGPIIRANMNGFKRLFRDLITRTEDGHAVTEAAFMKLMIPITSSYCARPSIVEIYNNILLLEKQAGSIYKGLSLQGLIAAICKVAIEIFAAPEWIERFPTSVDRLRLTFFFIDGPQSYFRHTESGLPLDRSIIRSGPKLPTTWRAATNEASKLVEDFLGVESNVRGLLSDNNSSLAPIKPTVPLPQGPGLTVASQEVQLLPKFTSPTLLKMNNTTNEIEESGIGYRRINGLLPHTASLHVLRHTATNSSSSSSVTVPDNTVSNLSHLVSSPKLNKQFSFSSVQGYRPLHPSSTNDSDNLSTTVMDEIDSVITDSSSVPASAIYATNITNNTSFAVHNHTHSLNESQDSIIPVEMTVDELEAFLEDDGIVDENNTTLVPIATIDPVNTHTAEGISGSLPSFASVHRNTALPSEEDVTISSSSQPNQTVPSALSNQPVSTSDDETGNPSGSWDARHSFENQRRLLASRIATHNELEVIRGTPGHPTSPLLALVKDAKSRGVRSPHVHQPILNSATFSSAGNILANPALIPRPPSNMLTSPTGFSTHDNHSHISQSNEDQLPSRHMRTDDLVITADSLISPSGTVPTIPSSFPTSVRFADEDDLTSHRSDSINLKRDRFSPNRVSSQEPSTSVPSNDHNNNNTNSSSSVSLPIPSTVIDGVPFTFPPLSTSTSTSSSSSSFPRANDNNEALTTNELSFSKVPTSFGNSTFSSVNSTTILAAGPWQKKLRVPPGLTQRQALDHARAYVVLQQQNTVPSSTEQDGDDFVMSQMMSTASSSSSASVLTLPDPNPLFFTALSFENGVPLQADAILGTAAASNALHATSSSSSRVLSDAGIAHNAEVLARTSAFPDVPPGKPVIILHPMRHDGNNPLLPTQIEDRSTINLVSHLLHDDEHPLSSTLSSSLSSKKRPQLLSQSSSHVVPVNHLAPIAVTGALGHPSVPPPLSSVLSLSSSNTSSNSKVKFNASTVSWNTDISRTKSINVSSYEKGNGNDVSLPSTSSTAYVSGTIGALPHWAVTEGMIRKVLRMDTKKVDTIVQAIFKRYCLFGGHDHSRITMVKGGGSIAELSDDRIESNPETIRTIRLNQNSFTKFALDAGLIGRGGHGAQDFRRGDIAVVYHEALAKMANVGTHGSISKLSTAGVPTTVKIWKESSFSYREINRSMLHLGLDYPSFRYALTLAAVKRYGSRTTTGNDTDDGLSAYAKYIRNPSPHNETIPNVIIYAKDINRSLGYALLTLRHILPLAIHTGLLAAMDEIYQTDKPLPITMSNVTTAQDNIPTMDGSTNHRPLVPVQPLGTRSRSSSMVSDTVPRDTNNDEGNNSVMHYIPAPLVRSRAASIEEEKSVTNDAEVQARERLQKISKSIETRLSSIIAGGNNETEISPPKESSDTNNFSSVPSTPGRGSRSSSIVLSPSAVAPFNSIIAAIAKSPSVRSRSSSFASVSNGTNFATTVYAPVLIASAQQSKPASPEVSSATSPIVESSMVPNSTEEEKESLGIETISARRLPVTASLWSEVLGQDLRLSTVNEATKVKQPPQSPTAVTVASARATARTADRVIVHSPQQRRSLSSNRQRPPSYASRASIKAQLYDRALRLHQDLNPTVNHSMHNIERSSPNVHLNVDTSSLRRPSEDSMHTSDLYTEEVMPYDPIFDYSGNDKPSMKKPEVISGVLGANTRYKANPWSFRISSPIRKPAWRPSSTAFAANEQDMHTFQQNEERRIAEHTARMIHHSTTTIPYDHQLHTASSFFPMNHVPLPPVPRSNVSPDKHNSHTNRINQLALPKSGHSNTYQSTDNYPDGLPGTVDIDASVHTLMNVHRQIRPPHIHIDLADITTENSTVNPEGSNSGYSKKINNSSFTDVDALLIQEAIEIANLLKERVAQLPNSSPSSSIPIPSLTIRTSGTEETSIGSTVNGSQSPKSSLKVRSPGLLTNSPETVARVYTYRSRSSSANLSDHPTPRGTGNGDENLSSVTIEPTITGPNTVQPGVLREMLPTIAEPSIVHSDHPIETETGSSNNNPEPSNANVEEEVLFSPSNNTLLHSQMHLPDSPGTELSISPFTITSDQGISPGPSNNKPTEETTDLPSGSPSWSSPDSSPNTVVSIPPPVPPAPSTSKFVDNVVQLITYSPSVPIPLPSFQEENSSNIAPSSPSDQAASRHIMWSTDVGTPPPASRVVLPGSLPTSPVMDLPVLGLVSSTINENTSTSVPLSMQSPVTTTSSSLNNGGNNELTPDNPSNGIITTPVDARVPPPDERDIPSTERAQREWQRRYANSLENDQDTDGNEGGGNIIGSLNATMESVFNGTNNMYGVGGGERTQESIIGSTDTTLNTTDSSFWPIFSPNAPANTPVAERYTFIRAGPGMGNATPGALIAVPRVRESKNTNVSNENTDVTSKNDNNEKQNGTNNKNNSSSSSSSSSSSLPSNAPFRIHIHAGGVEVQSGNTLMNTTNPGATGLLGTTTGMGPVPLPGFPQPSGYHPSSLVPNQDHHVTAAATPAATNNTLPRTTDPAIGINTPYTPYPVSSYPLHPPDTVGAPSSVTTPLGIATLTGPSVSTATNNNYPGMNPAYFPPPSAHTMHPSALHYPSQNNHNLHSTMGIGNVQTTVRLHRSGSVDITTSPPPSLNAYPTPLSISPQTVPGSLLPGIYPLTATTTHGGTVLSSLPSTGISHHSEPVVAYPFYPPVPYPQESTVASVVNNIYASTILPSSIRTPLPMVNTTPSIFHGSTVPSFHPPVDQPFPHVPSQSSLSELSIPGTTTNGPIPSASVDIVTAVVEEDSQVEDDDEDYEDAHILRDSQIMKEITLPTVVRTEEDILTVVENTITLTTFTVPDFPVSVDPTKYPTEDELRNALEAESDKDSYTYELGSNEPLESQTDTMVPNDSPSPPYPATSPIQVPSLSASSLETSSFPSATMITTTETVEQDDEEEPPEEVPTVAQLLRSMGMTTSPRRPTTANLKFASSGLWPGNNNPHSSSSPSRGSKVSRQR